MVNRIITLEADTLRVALHLLPSVISLRISGTKTLCSSSLTTGMILSRTKIYSSAEQRIRCAMPGDVTSEATLKLHCICARTSGRPIGH